MTQTIVEWQHIEIAKFMIDKSHYNNLHDILIQAKEMEKQQKLKHQLFIGKVSDIIGFEKTIELLKECNTIIGEIEK